MKKVYPFSGLIILVLMLTVAKGWSQTVVFSDDFSTNTSATYTTSGAIGSSEWSVLTGGTSGQDFGARRNTSPAQLELTNDATANANLNGWVLASSSTSSFLSPYNTTLGSNTGDITWTFNMRQIRSDPSGFSSGNYGVAYILAGSSTTTATAGTGYAVVLGQSGSTDPIRLIKYNGGIQGTLTNIITSNTTGLSDFGTEYLSLKVSYIPASNTWELSVRNDGTTAFSNPAAGTLVSQGTAIDATYTSTSLTLMGAYWQGSTAGTQTAFFDNVKVVVVPYTAPTVTTTTASSITSTTASSGGDVTADGGATITARGVVYGTSANPTTAGTKTTETGTTGSFTSSLTGLSPTTTYYYRAYATNSVGTSYGSELSFPTAAAGTPTLSTSAALPDFGNVCINTTAGPNSFTINGSNLDGTNITISALPGFTYSETSTGTYINTLSFSYTGSSFTGKVIYVKFTPTAVQSYDGNINVSGGGVSSFNVPATGSGVNTPPTITTVSATNIMATTATINATINSSGCTTITNYGFYYRTALSPATRVSASNLNAGNYSYDLTGLTPNERYFYRAYVTNGTDTTFATELAFNAKPLPVPMASQPGLSYTEDFHDIANWSDYFINGVGANHWDGLAATGTGGIPNGTTITAETQTFVSFSGQFPGTGGGVQRGTQQLAPAAATQSIVLLSTGGTDNTSSAAIDFYMDFTGVNAGTLSFDWASINNSTGDRKGSMKVYGSVNGTTFTEITSAAVLNFTNNSPTNGSITNVALPASFNTNPNARLRFYYYNGTGGTTGSRPKLSIDNLTVTAVPSTPCTTPTAQPTSMVFGTKTDVSIQGSFTAANPASDQYLTIVSNNSTLTSNPVDGVTYNVGESLGDGTVIARGSSLDFTATGLSPSTTYYFFTFALNGICTGGPKYLAINPLTNSTSTNAPFPPCTAPASQASQLVFANVTTTSIQGSFSPTSANEYLVLRSTSSSLTATPQNGQTYNIGDALGNAIVVQRNNTTSFTSSGLTPGTTYYFFIFSLNSQNCVNGPAYNTNSPLTGSQATMPLPPCIAPTSQPRLLELTASNTSISGTFNGSSSADNYLVIRSTSSTLSALPSNNTEYSVGSSLGGGVVIANSSATSFLTTGLAPGTMYYFFVFAANKNCSGGTKYLTTSPLTGNATTNNAPSNNYYFGSLHSHSDYSDGNKDQPGLTPADDYNYAKNAQCMDFLGISEHNHFSSPDNPGNLLSTYHQGTVQANNFNAANPNFVALYGMEWGVSNSGGGHVLVYGDGMDDLFGWESGSGQWGSSNNYDVFVPKSIYLGSTGLFKTVNDYVGKNTFATLAHPNLTDFNNLANVAYNDVADMAITGTAVESGPAFSTNTTYSNPGSSLSYLWYYQTMLSKGYRLGPTIDHDNHNTTFGKTTYSRTAVVAPALSKTEIIKGLRNMHFYATQDCDAKIDFTVNTRMMGSEFTGRNAPTILVTLTDPTTNISSAVIRLMSGTPGSGLMPVKIDSIIGTTLYFIDNNLLNNATAYYYAEITNGNARMVTSPIWYTRTSIPEVSINDVSMTEGNSGTKTFSYTVSLSTPAPAGGVTFNIATADNTATSASGDYVSNSLTSQTIPAGSSTYTFDVTVNGDAIVEGNETFFVNVTNVSANAFLSDGQGVGTILEDDNQAPTDITLTPASVPENRPANTRVGKLTTTDPDAGQTFTYTLVPGAGSDNNALFSIGGLTGDSILTSTPFNFEVKNSYTIRVLTTDNGSPAKSFEKQFIITVTNVNDTPIITSNGGRDSAFISIPENTTFVTTVQATDPDVNTSPAYSITGGADRTKFTISSTSGALSFITAPDFEAPTDADGTNTYIVNVRAQDQGGLFDDQLIIVTVTDVSEGILPVNLVNIKAYQTGAAIQVEWTTLTESNTDRFEVEKSTDGQTFTPIGNVAARGNSNSQVNYQYLDNTASTGSNYYRIKSIDKNGLSQFNNVVRVNVTKASGAITIYPHPVKNNIINLQLSNLQKGKYTVTLTNKLGQQLYRSVIEHNGGTSTQTLRINSSFPKGSYQLQVIGDDVRMTKQLIKN